MVLIIIATCAGMGVLSAISAQAAPLRPRWPLQPDSLFPVLSKVAARGCGYGQGQHQWRHSQNVVSHTRQSVA
jgi:hypothetical protein